MDTDGINTDGQSEKAKEKEDNPPSRIKESCHPGMYVHVQYVYV